jgi:hypothetical protein
VRLHYDDAGLEKAREAIHAIDTLCRRGASSPASLSPGRRGTDNPTDNATGSVFSGWSTSSEDEVWTVLCCVLRRVLCDCWI